MPLTIFPDLGQAQIICGGVKLVSLNPNPPPIYGQTQLTHSKNQPEMNPIHKKSTSTIIDIKKKDKQKRS